MPTTTQRTIALENLRKEIEEFEEEQSLKLLFGEDPLDIYDLLFEDEVNFSEYDISASPNDFNIKTIYDFIKSGIVKRIAKPKI